MLIRFRAVLARVRLTAVATVVVAAAAAGVTAPPMAVGATVVARAAGTARAAGAAEAARRLADRYAPIVMVRAQSSLCNVRQEQFAPPTSVGSVLGNPSVRLLRLGPHGPVVVKRAPTAADLAGRGPEDYLDLPGNPLNPRCTYAKVFRALRRAGRAPAVTYAHIAYEPGSSGFALQYWFYYYFNQFNDLHESDWEGIQLAFDAATPAQALAEKPSEIVLFQHAGGEHAGWEDSRVQKDGVHPVVYAAAGSHATYFDSQLYLGNGAHGSGVGCDDTTRPLVAVRPEAVLLPDQPVMGGRFAWLSYRGHWGQRESGFNDGPEGPVTKAVWRAPLSWMGATRTSSPVVPAGTLLGPSVARRFCGAVAGVTLFMNLASGTALGPLPIALVLLALFLLVGRLTRWRPVQPDPLNARRALGQTLLTAAVLVWRRRGTMTALALSAVLIIGALDGLEYVLLRVIGARQTDLSFTDSGTTLGLATSAGILQPLVTVLASTTAVAVIRNLDWGAPVSFRRAWGTVIRRLGRILAAQVLFTVVLIGLMITIVGIPYAIKKFADWMFFQQELIFENRSIREALHGSRAVVRGRWIHAVGYAMVFLFISELLGPFLSYAFLFTAIPAMAVNVLGAVLFAVLIQYAAVGRTLIYLDLKAHPARAAAPAADAVAPAPAT